MKLSNLLLLFTEPYEKRLVTYSREVMFTSAKSIWKQLNKARTQANFNLQLSGGVSVTY
jgi:hypothetical protein